jgi:hypothetical protein
VAVELTRKEGINRTAKELHVAWDDLKRRVAALGVSLEAVIGGILDQNQQFAADFVNLLECRDETTEEASNSFLDQQFAVSDDVFHRLGVTALLPYPPAGRLSKTGWMDWAAAA